MDSISLDNIDEILNIKKNCYSAAKADFKYGESFNFNKDLELNRVWHIVSSTPVNDYDDGSVSTLD
ncbi:hypothetical protein [Chryseobacterium polytrichastri]|uniref:Uncharacterized protein n=1 Tax=Chryseobacterium polytrichastri TaxID=1302687 RepID=A0A1M7L1Y5_9FLAO|nr:hypothetical protein [Chryseobacterium polytrichastri]SHM71770.1 hypothetical protein SAMN05444267_10804 [Chryseobacterium polytrichastri]